VSDGNNCHINTNGRIQGGAAGGIYYLAGSGTPTTGPNNQNRVTGTPPLATSAAYDDSYEAVFGLDLDRLRAVADAVITDPSEFPSPLPTNALVIVEPTSAMHWDNSTPLLGTGIVIVVGNAQISQGSYSNFSGLLYVDGNLTVRAPSEIRGSVICTGNVNIQGVPDFATITYDDGVLNSLRANFGNYQRSNSLYRPNLAGQ
jgi:hypothetical protein